ncbi:MAG: thioredoxin domain-containing protein [Ignavibacteriae bacterium]|nr:thioredoxin domain-containing protein [Ignavibacteriota bacterium]
MVTNNAKPNPLINEKSPYLLQHAYNPVEWHPWNEETFKLAKKEDKPIFLSIGYSTCYWCHVMEREVFEDPEIAELMNKYFVNIKVDREERPDVDRIYMIALQAMTGAGGWPMSMFLTPDLKPFYGATYIPPKAKYGRTGFEDVIEEIHKVWTNKKDEVIQSSDKIVDLLEKNINEKAPVTEKFSETVFDKCFETSERIFDFDEGGFGTGNKFPRPVVFDFLLAYYFSTGNKEALDIVTFSLHKMYRGGMFDHLAGGFHRYSVDPVWRVPHFEKMLYDQAQLVTIYLDTYLITKKELFLGVAEKTLEYVSKYLTSPDGGFYSAEDAESALHEDKPDDKEEGTFYLWTQDEINDALGSQDGVILNNYFGTQPNGNTLNDPHDVFGNKNVLFISKDIYDLAKLFNKPANEVLGILKESKTKLLEEREKRPRPHLDDKILTSWNALMISAFAKAYTVTGNEKYLASAENSARFILANLYKDGTLLHRYRDGDARFDGSLEDYSYMIQALIDLYEATFNIDYLNKAIELNSTAVGKFYDNENGGFFDVAGSPEDIILKTKESYDGAEPAGNSIQILSMLKLGIITEDNSLTDKAVKSLEFFYENLDRAPFSSPQMLFALYFYMKGSVEIILSGDRNDKFEKFLKKINNTFIPTKVILHAEDSIKSISPFIENIVSTDKENKVYICKNYKCDLPIESMDKLEEALNSLETNSITT